MTSYRAGAWLALAVCALLPASARAQDEGGGDDDIERLRQQAEDELQQDQATPDLSEEDQLRHYAESEAEDTDPLYQQLLDAWSSFSNRLNAFNPRLTVLGDTLGRLSAGRGRLVENGYNLDNRISLREIEIDIRADVDPYSKGVLVASGAEESPGQYSFSVEEGYLTLETIPFGFRAKIGRFRVPFGRINELHGHDLPQADYPLIVTDLFGEEGFKENGAIVSWLAPWFPLTLTGALLNGENQQILAGGNSDDPAWLARAEYFLTVTDTLYLVGGGSFLFGYNDSPTPVDAHGAPKFETQLWGADVMLKYQPSQYFSIVAQGELFSLKKEVGPGQRDYGFGGYAFVQVQPLQRWYAGFRYDWSNYQGGVAGTKQYSLGAWVSFYATEFLRFRLGYEHHERSGGERDLDTLFFQLTFVFGSHPAEPFWVNR